MGVKETEKLNEMLQKNVTFYAKWTNKKRWNGQTVFIFDFSKNMNPRLYILFLIDKSMT